VIETAGRRVLAGFQFVDAVTGLPIASAASIAFRGATVGSPPAVVPVSSSDVRLQRTRSGIYALFTAPFFDAFTASFENPQAPAETAAGPLRLRLAVVDAGTQYLPQEFEIELPRSIDPAAADSVFVPHRIALFRAPGAPTQDGWAVLRVSVTERGTSPPVPLPGVLVSVFRSPRAPNTVPIGSGMTDWRGRVRGEALVPLPSLQRFRPGGGGGSPVVATDHTIEFEATRDTTFGGGEQDAPDAARLLAGTAAGIVRPPNRPAGSQLNVVEPSLPVRVQAGREYVVRLRMS
jgi:hypothetical protein